MIAVRVDMGTRDFYTSLPARLRTKILARAVRTFVKQRGPGGRAALDTA